MKIKILDIMRLAIPAMVATIAGVISMLACARILGDYSVNNYYLLAVFLPINYMMIAVYESIRATSLTLSSSSYHNGNFEDIGLHVVNLIIISLMVFAALLVAFMISGKWIAQIIGVIQSEIQSFFNLSCLMITVGSANCIGYIFSSTFFAMKKPVIGMLVALLACALICILTYIFSVVFKLSWVGYGISIGVSYLISISVSLFLLIRENYFVLPSFEKFRDGLYKNLYHIIQIGLPVLLAYFLIFSSLFFINAVLSNFGENVLTGFSIGYRIQNLIILPAITIGTALAILISKARVSASHDEEKEIYLIGLSFCLLIYIGIALPVYFLREYWVSLVTENPVLIHFGSTYLKCISFTYIAMGPNLAYLTALEQSGFGVKSFFINIVYFLIAVGIGGVVALHYHHYTYLYSIMGLFNILIFIYLFFPFYKKQMIKNHQILEV